MKDQMIDNNSLSYLIAEKIAEQIITGELVPGEKVVETAYASEFGTSRAPIREALYLLTIEGLIERIPRKGAVVKGYTESEAYDLLEIRIMLESMAMKRISVVGVNQSIIKEMENKVKLMDEVENDNQDYANLNHQFHLHLIEMSQSSIIKNMYSRLGIPLLSLQRISFLEEKNMQKSLREHQLIVNLLKEGRSEEAHSILEKHNQDVISRVDDQINKE
ncbi:GntR family transcriptional regulator [Tuberibacillus sp. Marseille-P3662]|uniref:GntR family transcriptional regulator n=1 Tax=Tuberibacillus sp. Marseille-P3662 TaxID=1965358 RepID=UPI000A1C808F|nr:GntR family transcriptional regulator [Tuberibacillus sp. Marseille-P3662]